MGVGNLGICAWSQTPASVLLSNFFVNDEDQDRAGYTVVR